MSNKDIYGDTKEKEIEYEKKIKKLWSVLKNVDDKKREKILSNLDEKTIIALRTYNNPYKKPVIEGGKNRYLAFNIINMTEKYSQRFAMTSLIGYIYRMLDEYEPDDKDNFVSENDPKFANLYNKLVKDKIMVKPEKLLMEEFEVNKCEIEKLKLLTDNENRLLLRKKVKENFIIRSKVIKYNLYLLKDNLKILKDKKDSYDREIKNLSNESKNTSDNLGLLKVKLEKRIKLDLSSDKSEDLDTNLGEKRTIENTFTVTDAKRTIISYENDILNKTKLLEKLSSDLQEKNTEYNKLSEQIETLNVSIGKYNEKFKELKDEYIVKLEVKKVRENKLNKNKISEHPLDNVEIDKYEPTEQELDEIAEQVKKELNITKTYEEYTEELQNNIQIFLDKYFRYNPDNHVRCAYKPNYEDPTRIPLKTDNEGNIIEESAEKSIIPPDDTFFRWNRYIENNYEPLRQATDDIYCEKSDFESDIVPLEVFEGDSKEEAEEKFNQYKRRYADEFESDVFSAKFLSHNLLSPWYQNKEIRDFYTEKTEIIKRIIDQNKEDSRAGQKLMKKRAKQKKSEDIKKLGPDPESHRQFLDANPPKELKKHGAVHVSEIETTDYIKADKIPVDKDESTKDEVEIDVHVIKPKSSVGRRRVRGFAEQWKFHVQSEKLPEGGAEVNTPKDFQKKLLQQENSV